MRVSKSVGDKLMSIKLGSLVELNSPIPTFVEQTVLMPSPDNIEGKFDMFWHGIKFGSVRLIKDSLGEYSTVESKK